MPAFPDDSLGPAQSTADTLDGSAAGERANASSAWA